MSSGVAISVSTLSVVDVTGAIDMPDTSFSCGDDDTSSSDVLPALSGPSPDLTIAAETPNIAVITHVHIAEMTRHPLPVRSSVPSPDLIGVVDTPNSVTRVHLSQYSRDIAPGSSIFVEAVDVSVGGNTPCSSFSVRDMHQSSGDLTPASSCHLQRVVTVVGASSTWALLESVTMTTHAGSGDGASVTLPALRTVVFLLVVLTAVFTVVVNVGVRCWA